ncbi:MAG: hypothetical protein KIT09_07860 [Bryobacteraceae bacterium]|nr:hypothetical protein [Bryobacteraceae bacterium]
MRFDELIRSSMIVRDVKVEHPETIRVFDNHGFRDACDDCSIEQVARKHGLRSQDLVAELNQAVASEGT